MDRATYYLLVSCIIVRGQRGNIQVYSKIVNSMDTGNSKVATAIDTGKLVFIILFSEKKAKDTLFMIYDYTITFFKFFEYIFY